MSDTSASATILTPEIKRCNNCAFPVGKVVGSRGPIDSPFVIVGESPGTEEVKGGAPFLGPSGKVIEEALKLFPEYPEPYITNAFKCFPGKAKDPASMAQACRSCNTTLMAELKAYPRKVILALGNGALWALLGDTSLKITKERGKLFPSQLAEVGIVASVHPAFLLRGGGSFRQFKADVRYALHLLSGGEPRKPEDVTYEVLNSTYAVDWLTETIRAHARVGKIPHNVVAADHETTGFSHRQDQLISVGYTFNGRHVYIIPLLDKPHLYPAWRRLHALHDADAEAEAIEFVWHNGKFDGKFNAHNGAALSLDHDTMMMSYALDEVRGLHDLEQVASDWLGSPNWKAMLDGLVPKGGNYSHIPRHILYKYQAFDIANTYNLYHILRPQVAADPKSELLYTKTLMPGSQFLAGVEMVGMRVDLKKNAENDIRLQAEVDKYTRAINDIARPIMGYDINPNSPKQLGEFIYDHLKLKAKGNSRSTDEDTLLSLPKHPAITNLLHYRKVKKAHSTYVKSLPELIADDGRVHQTYLLHGTATGRLACRNPNLQNIPRDPELRGQFIPRDGYIFLEVDLNQAELRSLACLSGDPDMIRIYTSDGVSIHEEVRAFIWGNPDEWDEQQVMSYLTKFYLTPETRYNEGSDRIVDEQKMRAKCLNFGIVYGREAFSIAEEFGITPQEAQGWINKWFERFPKARAFIQACRNAPLLGKNLVTVFGHKKRFGVVSPEKLKDFQNQAANFPHQSTASTINLHGAMNVQPILEHDLKCFINNLVHDSILVEVPDDKSIADQAQELLITELQAVPVRWGLTRVPFLAEAKLGTRWGSLTKPKTFWEHHLAS